MKKFKFKLEKLLDIRIRKEDQLKQEYAQIRHRLETETQKLNTILNNIEEAHIQKQNLLSNAKPHSSDIEAYGNYISALFLQKESQNILIEQIKVQAAKKREELLEASKEKKILEKLKEKQKYNYLLEIDHLEQKDLDEIASHMDNRENPNRMKFNKILFSEISGSDSNTSI